MYLYFHSFEEHILLSLNVYDKIFVNTHCICLKNLKNMNKVTLHQIISHILNTGVPNISTVTVTINRNGQFN